MSFCLVLVREDGRTREIEVAERALLGRDESCEVRIPAGVVSRRHCEILVDEEEDEVVVRDLGSSNGTFVNGERVSQKELSPGDVLCVGPAVFVARLDGFPKEIDASGALRVSAAAQTASTSKAVTSKSAGRPAGKPGADSPTRIEQGSSSGKDAEGSGFFDDFDFGDDDKS